MVIQVDSLAEAWAQAQKLCAEEEAMGMSLAKAKAGNAEPVSAEWVSAQLVQG